MIFNIDSKLKDLSDFRRLTALMPFITDQTAITDSVKKIERSGAFDPFAGYLSPSSIEIQGNNYRETIVARGTNSRGRGVLLALADFVVEHGTDIDVYACESMTPFSARLREIFQSRFIGSEYIPLPAEREKHPQTRHEDVMALSFASKSFDAYISCEVMEHVPDIARTLAEAHRILRPGGLFFGTVPFHYGSGRSVTRARLRDGVVEHLMPPEYHGNPVDPSGGSLVFEIPGWDLLDRCRAAGFQDASVRFIASTKYAIHGAEIAGVFLFAAHA